EYIFYTQGIQERYKAEDLVKAATPDALNEELIALKRLFWTYVFEKTRLGRDTTSNFQKKFESTSAQLAQLAFTKRNIIRVLEMFFLDRHQIILECLLQVFDQATAYHKKNQIHTEGWVTNKAWKIAPKIIMPNGIGYDGSRYGGFTRVWHRNDFFK